VSVFRDRILIIKLDAIGDVLRSASLLPAIIDAHDAPYVAWMTRPESAELVSMMQFVDEVIELSHAGLARIAAGGWTRVYALSNDMTSASLATLAPASQPPVGYHLTGGVITPSNDAARRWLEMAAFDRLKRANTETYQAHMLAILGADPAVIPAPALRIPAALRAAATARLAALFPGSARRKVAINVGSGGRWPKKMLNDAQIAAFIGCIRTEADVDIVLVGGAAEAAKTDAILTGFAGDDRVRAALTEQSIAAFVALLDQMDVLFCGDTLALHIATAVGLPTVAVFGPTSIAEIPDFGGLVTKAFTRDLDCLVCYGDCDKVRNCMTALDVAALARQTLSRLENIPRPAG
jgi:ADP-heptose:LPS heptosyltransferase